MESDIVADESGGASSTTNGTSIPVISVIELETKLAQYRTALIALVSMVKREGGWRSTQDQQLLRQIDRLLAPTK